MLRLLLATNDEIKQTRGKQSVMDLLRINYKFNIKNYIKLDGISIYNIKKILRLEHWSLIMIPNVMHCGIQNCL